MKGANKNVVRTIVVGVLIVIAAVISFVLLPKLYRVEGKTASVVMMKVNVEKGSQITSDMVVTTTVGSYGLNGTIIQDPQSIIGKYAATDISSKDLLFPEKFSDTPILGIAEEKDIEIPLADDQMLLTLALPTTAAGAAGHIMPGDKVNVAIYKNPEAQYDANGNKVMPSDGDNAIFPESLQGMTAYRVLTNQLTTINPKCDVTATNFNERVPAYITLICTQDQADLLIDYSYTHTIHFLEAE